MNRIRRRIATVIATLEERDNLAPLVRRLSDVFRALPELHWEPVFVVAGDDGSAEYLERFGGFRVIRQRSRGGLAEAFRAGFDAVDSEVDIVVTMDGDLNHRPEDLPRLLGRLDRLGADIVVGSRWVPGAVVDSGSWVRWLASRVGNAVVGLLFGIGIRDRSSGFRVYRRSRLAELPVEGSGFSFLPAMLLAAESGGMRIAEEPIAFDRRLRGRSKLPVVATALGYLRLAATSSGRPGAAVRRELRGRASSGWSRDGDRLSSSVRDRSGCS